MTSPIDSENEVPTVTQEASPILNPEGRVHVVNLGDTTLNVQIYNPNTGETDEVFLQPGGKPKLPFGFMVVPAYLTRNARVLRVVAA